MFKIIESDISRSGKTLSLFGRDLSLFVKNWNNTQGLKNRLNSAFTNPNIISKDDLTQIYKYNEAIRSGVNKQSAFYRYLSNSSVAVQNLAANAKYGTINTEGLTIATEQLTTTQKLASLATKALTFSLNLLANVGIALVINLITKAIYKVINAAKEAEKTRQESIQSAKDYKSSIDTLNSTYKQEVDTLEDLKSRYTELIASTNDINTIRSDLSSLQQEIIDKYGIEADGIDLVNKKYSENIRLLQEKKKEDAKQFLFDNSAKIEEAKKRKETIYDKGELANVYLKSDYNFDNDMLTEFAKIGGDDIQFRKNHYGSNVYGIEIGGEFENAYDTLVKMADKYKEMSEAKDEYNSDVHQFFIDEANRIKDLLEADNDLLEKANEANKTISDSEIFEGEKGKQKQRQYDSLTEQVKEMNQAFLETNSSAKKIQVIEDLSSVKEQLLDLVTGNKEYTSSVELMFETLDSNINQYINSITSSADTYISTFTDYAENGFKTATENIDTFKSALQSLNDDGYISAETMWKLIEMDSSLSDSFVKVADGFKISSDKIIDSKDELIKKELEYAESEADTSKKILTNLKLRLQAIQKQKEIERQYLQDNGANSAWDVNRLKQYDYEIKQIEDSISEVESTSKKWNLAISQIKSGLGDTVPIADKLKKQSEEIESNIDKIQDRIDSLNDEIEDLQDKQEELLKYQEYQIDKIIDKLESEQKVLEDEKTALEEQLEILENQKLEIEEQIKIYEDIVSIVEDAINDEKSAIEKEKDLVQSEKEELQKQLDILEDKKASIEDSIQDYEKIYSLVSDIIDKETESIEKERDAVESYYDDMISKLQEENDERERSIELAEKEAALENAKRNKVRIYNEQKGWTWAEDTEAIKKAQDELDKFNNQIKIEDLEKEKEQKLKEFDDKISAIKEYGEQFTNGQQNYENNQTYLLAEKLLGMSREEIYEKIANQDADFVKQLNETYDKIQETRDSDIQSEIDYINQQVKEKDNQIKVYEEMINEWDRYIDEWQKTVTEYKENQDKLIAEQKLGSDWLERVKQKDTSILNEFKSNYKSYQNALNGTISQEIADLQNSINAKEQEIESKKTQISEWNDYKDQLSGYVDSVSQTWSDYVTNLDTVVLDENSTFEQRENNLEAFKSNYRNLVDEIMSKQDEMSNLTSELEEHQSRLNEIQEQQNSINFQQDSSVYDRINELHTHYQQEKDRWDYYNSLGINSEVDAENINEIASRMRGLRDQLRELYSSLGIQYDAYATGGVNTKTGFAWLDGTPNKPELVLNNTDTTKLYNLLHTLSVDQLKQKFHFDTFSNPPKSLNAMANNTSAVNNNNNSQNIILNFYGNIETNSPADFLQQMNRYIQHNKLNGRINY